jgi:hypothetical protein
LEPGLPPCGEGFDAFLEVAGSGYFGEGFDAFLEVAGSGYFGEGGGLGV